MGCNALADPMVCTTLFRVPQCRDLGLHEYHEDDYTVFCDSSSFYAAYAVALLMIILVPFGTPAAFLFYMYNAKQNLPDGKPNKTLLGGAKLCSAELKDEDDRYGFLCRDLRPEYWYYEIVTCKMIRVQMFERLCCVRSLISARD